MNKEWDIGKHKVWFDEEKKVLYYTINGNYCGSEHREFLKLYPKAFEGINGKFALVNLTNATPLSKETRRSMKEEEEKISEGTDKMAFIGASPAIRMIAKIVMKLSKNKNVAFFRSEKEALDWFKEENN
jgi:hypothetical protein